MRDRRIRIAAKVSKTRKARMVEGVPAVLWRLLRPLAKKTGPVLPAESLPHAVYHWIYERRRAAKQAGVTLSHDVFRHTFATYYVSLTGHPDMAAKVLGHCDLAMLQNHYDGVAPRDEAREYFGLPRRRKRL